MKEAQGRIVSNSAYSDATSLLFVADVAILSNIVSRSSGFGTIRSVFVVSLLQGIRVSSLAIVQLHQNNALLFRRSTVRAPWRGGGAWLGYEDELGCVSTAVVLLISVFLAEISNNVARNGD